MTAGMEMESHLDSKNLIDSKVYFKKVCPYKDLL